MIEVLTFVKGVLIPTTQDRRCGWTLNIVFDQSIQSTSYNANDPYSKSVDLDNLYQNTDSTIVFVDLIMASSLTTE